VRRGEREADIQLVLDTGSKYFFGDIEIEPAILDPSFVGRHVRPSSPASRSTRTVL
jgi:hypothetical protein